MSLRSYLYAGSPLVERFSGTTGKGLIRVFLALFAASNLILMLLLTRGSLGLSSFWLTPVVVALMCWFDGGSLATTRLANLRWPFWVARCWSS